MPLPSSLQPFRHWHTSHGFGAVPWSEAAQKEALCLHLNFQGEAELKLKSGQRLHLRSQTLLWSRGAVNARRLHGRARHECLTLVYPDAWLTQSLPEAQVHARDSHRALIAAPFAAEAAHQRPLTQEDRSWAYSLIAPHLCVQAQQLLDAARLTDFLLRELFLSTDAATAPALSRTERVARERVERVKAELLKQLDEAPSLDDLAVAAGCSPHYLSRTFAQVEGLTLSLWLRRVRIERAAGLIASGQCNVSEAALEVGYHSFSHFSRAFAEEKGVSPSKWVEHLAARNAA